MSRHKITEIVLRVTFQIPRGASKQAAEQYVREAVSSHCGGLDASDPMFEVKRDCVRVSIMESHDYYHSTDVKPAVNPRAKSDAPRGSG